MDKENLIKHLKTKEDRYLGLRLLDKVEFVLKNYTIGFTDFLDPYQISLCMPILSRIEKIGYITNGIVSGAERQIIILYPEYMNNPDENDIPINALRINGDFRKTDISHRDVLGAILGLGIKREKIGDIYTYEGYAYIISFKEICDYILYYLDKISKYKVEVEKVSLRDIASLEDNYKLIYSTVPSLRLDVILSVGFEESRSSITKRINNDRVKVNWKPVNQISYFLNPGDIISFKGMGRIQLMELNGKSKKDRFKIIIKRFL